MEDIINGLPNIICSDEEIKEFAPTAKEKFRTHLPTQYDNVSSSFGIALHMHQPTIPAGNSNLSTAGLISNLEDMMNNQHIGDNHNAPVFMNCYSRISDMIRDHVDQGHNPRVMLDYSGNLLWGLRQMEGGRVLNNLKYLTCDQKYLPYVEWLGTMWSHAVVSSTPVPDIRLHITAWRKHFASIFGIDAVRRVKGFSPPEMHLPIHPDVCFEYIKALKECGYQWLMVQEHTIETIDGQGLNPYIPHKLVAKNSMGEVEEIIALIKTQGSDNKLVAQMQPYYEAKSKKPESFLGQIIPPYVCQIGDGENGGVMMNEFPPGFNQAFNEIGRAGVVAMNGSEYLEFIESKGLKASDFPAVQPITQHLIWENIKKFESHASDKAIEKIKEKHPHFNLDKGSWTNDRSWIKGYEDVLNPMNQLSVAFHKKYDQQDPSQASHYHEALLYLMLSQTSCFRYWGEGSWTEYAKELCRRGIAICS